MNPMTRGCPVAILAIGLMWLAGCSRQPDKPAAEQAETGSEVSAESPTVEGKQKGASVPDVQFNPAGMKWIPGGSFMMGEKGEKPDEQPAHEVTVNGFWMDTMEVTNRQFTEFADATGYVTMAEQTPDPIEFPNVPKENLVPGSVIFEAPPGEAPTFNFRMWWKWVPGASWRHPEGPDSSINDRLDHPVVHVCWFDVVEYAEWRTRETGVVHRLPTEAEWEYAARGGRKGEKYTWGNELLPGDKWQANIWQGRFPSQNTNEDGFRGTSPVGKYPPNGYGLHDMAGNVWEWCADWYRHDYYKNSPKNNPLGPRSSLDPEEPALPKKSTRGGSFLCAEIYCTGYRPSARMKTSPDTGLNHTGFRLVALGSPPANP